MNLFTLACVSLESQNWEWSPNYERVVTSNTVALILESLWDLSKLWILLPRKKGIYVGI